MSAAISSSTSVNTNTQGPSFIFNTLGLKFLMTLLIEALPKFKSVSGCESISVCGIAALNRRVQACAEQKCAISLAEYIEIRPALQNFVALTGIESGQKRIDKIVPAIDRVIAGLTGSGLTERRDYLIDY